MIKIAICDDCTREIENVLSFLDSYSKDHKDYDFSIQTFSDGDSLFKFVQKNHEFDIYLLDIMLKDGEVGTYLARQLRTHKYNGEIIFVTSSKDYAVEAFNLNATHYILKPFSKASFDAALDRAIANIKIHENDVVIKSTNKGILKVPVSEIVYSESSGHYQLINLISGNVIKVRKKTQELWEEFSKYNQFFKPHTGFIVNREHVKSMTTSTLTVVNGVIPLSKNSYKRVRQEYLDYVFGKGEKE